MKPRKHIAAMLATMVLIALAVGLVMSPPVRQHFAERSQFSKLDEPLAVTRTIMFTDGGTIGVTMEDVDGDSLSFCIDGRDIVNADGFPSNPTIHRVYLGAWYPEDSDAFLVAAGGYAESRIEGALSTWLESSSARVPQGPWAQEPTPPRDLDGRPPDSGLVRIVLEHLDRKDRGKGTGPFEGLGPRRAGLDSTGGGGEDI